MRFFAAVFLILAVGIGLIGMSTSMPEYHDAENARRLLNTSQPEISGLTSDELREARSAFNDQWFAAMDAARTDKWLLFDIGVGSILTALTLVFMFFYLKGSARGQAWHTPRARWRFIVYGSLVHFGVMASWWVSIHIEFFREYYPWWADSIGIPIWGIESFARTSWPVLVIAGIVLLLPAKLPAPLWSWSKGHPIWSGVWTLVHLVPGGILLFLIATTFATAMVWGLPFLIFGLYLIESSRSAGLAPRRPTPL